MPRDPRVYLAEAVRAGKPIQRFVEGKTLADYDADDLLHSAVERQFEIAGEALPQLATVSPELVASLPSYRRVVAFRNQLAHGYFAVQHDIVWTVATRDVPALVQQLRDMLGRMG